MSWDIERRLCKIEQKLGIHPKGSCTPNPWNQNGLCTSPEGQALFKEYLKRCQELDSERERNYSAPDIDG
jgi:hypothetical protein